MVFETILDAEADDRLWEIIDPGPARPLTSVDYYAENAGKRSSELSRSYCFDLHHPLTQKKYNILYLEENKNKFNAITFGYVCMWMLV